MSSPSRRPSVGRRARPTWWGLTRWAFPAVVAVASAVVCVRVVPHWAGLLVCAAGVALLGTTVADRVAGRVAGPRGRVRRVLEVPRTVCRAATSIPDEVVWEVAPDGRMTHLDERAAQLFGWDAATLTGRSIDSLLHPQEVGRARKVLAQAVAAGAGWSNESFRVVHRSGEVRWIHTSGLAHVGDDGAVRGFTAISRLFRDGDVVSANAAVSERVDRVIGERLLRTAFQPIVCVSTGRAVGVEALSRFPQVPSQAPDQWFRDADLVGRGVELELRALEQAAVTARALPEHLYVSLNVSPATLMAADLPDLLAGLGLPPARVVLEVTEHVGVENYEQLSAARQRLRAAGVRLAVDDAGAGYASFRHIVRLRPDVIKLDRGIISGIDAESAQRALAGALVSYAREVCALVLAEGVETAEELSTLSGLGIDAVQGYLLGRPTEDPEVWGGWQATRQVPSPGGATWGSTKREPAFRG